MKVTPIKSYNLRVLCALLTTLLAANYAYAMVHVSGIQSGTWTKANSPYILDGSVTVAAGTTLTIQAGVTVVFPSYSANLDVRGTLNAQGTISDSIRFKGQYDAYYNTQYGGGINLYTSNSIVKYLSLDSLGSPSAQASIWINPYDTITPTITNTTVKHTGSLDIYTWAGGSKNLVAVNGIVNIISGSVPGNGVLPNIAGSYYNLLGAVTVDAGKTLTIQAGVTVIFPSYSTVLNVKGTLTVQGTLSDSVRFKGKADSYYNTKYGGGINLYTSTSSLNYLSLDSLGEPSNQSSVWINPYDTITPTLSNISVKHSGSYDIYTWMGGAKKLSAVNGIINVISGSVPGNATVPKISGNNYYNLLGAVTVDAGRTLTIQAGTTVVFPSYSTSLIIKGTLNAQGTFADSIRFKGRADASYNTKYGGGINIYTSSVIMKYISMDSLGSSSNQASLWINPYDTITPDISNISIRHTESYDIYTWMGGAKKFSAINGVINILSGDIPGNATLPKITGNNYYYLLGAVTVVPGNMLTMQAGITVVFPSYSTAINVKGSLNALGTLTDSIKCKGTADPSYATKYGGGINLYTSTATIQYLSMDSLGSSSNQGAIWINPYDTLTPVITNTSVKHSESYDIYTWAGGAKNISNVNGVISIVSGSFTGNVIMPKTGGNSYYSMTGAITIDAKTSLTIQPGVTLSFPSYYSGLNVNGTLNAQGTASDSIRFKGRIDPYYSYYKYGGSVYINSSAVTMKYISIDSLGDPSSSGQSSVYINPYDSTILPAISNISIKHSGYYDIYTWAGGAKNIDSINAVISIMSGSIPQNAVMKKVIGSYYNLTGTVTVDAGKTLTIQPGAVLQFPSVYTDLTVNGTLNARGNVNDTIRFRGAKDVGNNTLYGGSINLDADGSKLSFISVDSMGGYRSGAIMAWGGFTMKYASIRNSYGEGVSMYTSKANVSYSNIYKNATGIGVNYYKVVINNCNIFSNSSYGVNNIPLYYLADATQNYWGASSGPYHPTLNKTGTGNKVSDSVQFKPYKTATVVPVLPYITAFAPAAGATDTVVKITGLRFTGTTKVLFGNTAAKSFTVLNDSTINAVVNAGSNGYVKVTNTQGSDSLDGFTYCSGIALHADFSYGVAFFNVNTFNTSVDATGYAWNFGDGASSTDQSPSHSYKSPGNYTLCLYDTNACAQRAETVCKVVVITGTTFTDNDKDGLYDLTETAMYGTSTANFDTNGDLLGDGSSVFTGYLPLSADTDNDGVSNLLELLNGTNPLLADTDNDGVNDKLDPFPLDRFRSKLPATNSSDHTAPTISVSEPF